MKTQLKTFIVDGEEIQYYEVSTHHELLNYISEISAPNWAKMRDEAINDLSVENQYSRMAMIHARSCNSFEELDEKITHENATMMGKMAGYIFDGETILINQNGGYCFKTAEHIEV